MDELVSDVIPRIYQAGLSEASWQDALDAVARRLDATGVLAYDIPTRGPARVVANRGFAPEALASYFDHYAGCNIWATSEAMVPGAMLLSSQLFPDARLKQTEYWSGWLRHVDVFYVAGGIVHADASSQVKLSFTRPESSPRFEAAEQRVLEALVPHLHASFGGHKRLQQVGQLVAPVLHTLDRMAQGVVILRADATVVHLNDCARALLEAQTELRLEGDVLTFRTPQLRERFEAYARPKTAQAALADLCFLLPGKPGMPRLQAAVVALPDQLAGSRHLALFVKEQRTPPAPPSALRQLYGLSPAEAQLATTLALGDTLADHAEQRGISIHTARSQLKSLSLKLGVSRQAEIVHLVTGLAQGWAGPH
jgi:DNA-binding CsgD family transcriptional regulator